MDCEGTSQLRMRVVYLYTHTLMFMVGKQGIGYHHVMNRRYTLNRMVNPSGHGGLSRS